MTKMDELKGRVIEWCIFELNVFATIMIKKHSQKCMKEILYTN